MGTLRAHAGLAFPSSPLTAGAGQRSESSVFTFEQVTLTACVEPRTRVRGLEVRARGREVRGVLRRQRPSHRRRVFPRRPRFDLVRPISVRAASQFLLEGKKKKLVLRQLRAGAAQRSYARCCFLFCRRPHVVLQLLFLSATSRGRFTANLRWKVNQTRLVLAQHAPQDG